MPRRHHDTLRAEYLYTLPPPQYVAQYPRPSTISRALPLALPHGTYPLRRVSGFRARSQSLARRAFVLRERSRCFPGAFPPFGSIPIASPARFQPLGALPSLPPCISMLRERSPCFPGAFPPFGSVPTASPAQFRLSGVRPHAHIGIVRAWRGNHTKSFHQEDEPWHRQQWQR